MRRGATDPVCGMKVDRAKAVRLDLAGRSFYFCSRHCAHAFEIDAERYLPAQKAAAARTAVAPGPRR